MSTDSFDQPSSSELAGPWEDQIGELLTMFSAVQGELLALLNEKRQLLLAADQVGLAAIAEREQELIGKLQACQNRRRTLLEEAAEQGLPSGSLQALSGALPDEKRQLRAQLRESRQRWRLLQHQSLTNWVLVQRTLLHLAQMLEIIATGGRPEPTYGRADHRTASGALVDQAI